MTSHLSYQSMHLQHRIRTEMLFFFSFEPCVVEKQHTLSHLSAISSKMEGEVRVEVESICRVPLLTLLLLATINPTPLSSFKSRCWRICSKNPLCEISSVMLVPEQICQGHRGASDPFSPVQWSAPAGRQLSVSSA